jgi:Putative Ig domain
VIASDDGDGDPNQVLVAARSFVVTVKSATEAPAITAPRQVVAVVGQALSVPVSVRDADQDPLTFTAQGLPAGAGLTPLAQYGQAVLGWTPTAADLGVHDVSVEVTDSGLGPRDAGYAQDPAAALVPNSAAQTVRVIVRMADAAPELIGLRIDGEAADPGASMTQVSATEGVPLAIELFGRDADLDLIDWSLAGLPAGMTVDVREGSPGSGSFALGWTPDLFAAQSDNLDGTHPGHYRFTVTASDGAARFSRSFEITVANANQVPQILPMPPQLVNEGDTLGFTLTAADADGDALRLALLHDEATPAGVSFDPRSGHFEWTPGQDVVDNAGADSHPFDFTFSASDGDATTLRTVQVRVFDVDRAPRLVAGNHALVVGQSFSLPVQLGTDGAAAGAITAVDDDGAAQTQALAISFEGLPEGAGYDAQTRRLSWVPGPGQVGDYTVTARASDGRNVATQSFTLRVVAEAEANAPAVLVSTTPGTPVQPGQTVVATVRAQSYGPMASIAVQVRGAALGDADHWQTVALDGLGRLQLVPTQPGLIEIRVTATDQDGFSKTTAQLVRVKDPADTEAPALAWSGAL